MLTKCSIEEALAAAPKVEVALRSICTGRKVDRSEPKHLIARIIEALDVRISHEIAKKFDSRVNFTDTMTTIPYLPSIVSCL